MNENNINELFDIEDDFTDLDSLIGDESDQDIDDDELDIDDFGDFGDLSDLDDSDIEEDEFESFSIEDEDFIEDDEPMDIEDDIQGENEEDNEDFEIFDFDEEDTTEVVTDNNMSDIEDTAEYDTTEIVGEDLVAKADVQDAKAAPRKKFSELTEEDINRMSASELEEYLSESEEVDIDTIENEQHIGYETLSVEEGVSAGADNDGTISNESDLINDEEDFNTVSNDTGFISSTGDIVVMDESENGENFKFQYIDIENIAIVKRIRKNTTNVEDLVQSIKSTGLLEPLVVAMTETEGIYVLLAGFRRIMACAKAGKRRIPCIVNLRASVPEIPVLEALYNHSKSYTIKERVDYIDYLEKQKGIMSASMIEYLLQMNSGDYTKLKDILNDNDDDIVDKLFNGIYTIEQAFKKLEQRRKKESAEEKENKKAAKVYEDSTESGADKIEASGEEMDDGEKLTDEEIQSFAFNASQIDDVEEEDLTEMIEESNQIEGFKPHKQDYKDRERLDPALRRSVLVRDNNTCRFCGMGGQEYQEVMDVHHLIEVYLGGDDSIDNLITACTCCHKLVHLFGRGDLHIRPMDELSDSEQTKFKKIVKAGNLIREGMAKKGLKKEQLKQVDDADTIGRTKPGTGQIAG